MFVTINYKNINLKFNETSALTEPIVGNKTLLGRIREMMLTSARMATLAGRYKNADTNSGGYPGTGQAARISLFQSHC